MCRDSILQATSSFELSSITVGGSGAASFCCSEGSAAAVAVSAS